MARLRQQHPQNYGSSTNISTEFENLVRYLNSAELGNKTVSELLKTLFNDDGEFDGPIEIRKDASAGLQYRVGEYDDPEDGWLVIAPLADIRGDAGQNVGEIGAPIFHARQDYTATAAQTDFGYVHAATDELLVWVNGLLKVEGAGADYTTDAVAGEVNFNAGLALNDKVTIAKVRSSSVSGYVRTDFGPLVAPQAVFPFVHDEDTQILVFKNGELLVPGGANDYTTDHASDTFTLTTTAEIDDVIVALTVENVSDQAVTGLMLEGVFTDPTTGLIPWAKIGVDNDEIPQGKVNGLASGLSEKAKLTVAAIEPETPAAGDLWLDTSQTPNELKFYDATQWLRTSPESSLPTFVPANAGQVVRVNGTGTALEYGDVDLSTAVAATEKGAANGVAELDSAGRLPTQQLPETIGGFTMDLFQAGAVANGDYRVMRIFGQKIKLTKISFRLSSGTCSIQIKVNGVTVGSVHAASSTPSEIAIGSPIEIDAVATSKIIEIAVTSQAAADSLDVAIGAETMSE